MENSEKIKLKLCFKEENGDFVIKNLIKDINPKMNLANLRIRLEKENYITSYNEFLDNNCIIAKSLEVDYILEDILKDKDKLYLSQRFPENKEQKIENKIQSNQNPNNIIEKKPIRIQSDSANKNKRKKEQSKKKENINLIESIIQIKKDNEGKERTIVKKDLLNEVNNFLSIIGPSGTGKSTFCSYYYQKRYNLEPGIFKPSDSSDSDTKGIWLLSPTVKHKIEANIERELLDVEGFDAGKFNSWRNTLIIAFLSTEVMILKTQNVRDEETKRLLTVMNNYLIKLKEKNFPRKLKKIYIHYSIKKNFDINKKRKFFDLDENMFDYYNTDTSGKKIKIEFIYFPTINPDTLEEGQEITDTPQFKENFENILNKLKKTEGIYNTPGSLIEYVDHFNQILNGDLNCNIENLAKDIESDFNGVYSRYEKKLKNELAQVKLKKVESLKETFEEFINKQNLNFKFKLNKGELTFYGSSELIDKTYDDLMEKKSFEVDKKEVFMDIYKNYIIELEKIELNKKLEEEKQNQLKKKEELNKLEEEKKETEKKMKELKKEELEKKKELEERRKKLEEEKERKRKELEEKERKEKEYNEKKYIIDLFKNKIREIKNYFSTLKFFEEINKNYELSLEVETSFEDFKNYYENELKKYFKVQEAKKKKEWFDQIERAKWKQIVQAYGELKCENGHNLDDFVSCDKCKTPLFWADSDEKYVICKGCPNNGLTKMTDDLVCDFCNGKSYAKVKWVIGYKP